MGQFLAWCAARGLGLQAVAPLHVAAYIRTHPGSAPTVKQHLAAIRMLGDWLVVSQVLPVLAPAEARRLLAAIDTGTLAGRRDRALVSVMLYSFARVSAVIAMRRPGYFRQERRGWLRLHEKGGTRHDVPAHHRAAEALDDYLARAGRDEAKAALFQSVDPGGAAADRRSARPADPSRPHPGAERRELSSCPQQEGPAPRSRPGVLRPPSATPPTCWVVYFPPPPWSTFPPPLTPRTPDALLPRQRAHDLHVPAVVAGRGLEKARRVARERQHRGRWVMMPQVSSPMGCRHRDVSDLCIVV